MNSNPAAITNAFGLHGICFTPCTILNGKINYGFHFKQYIQELQRFEKIWENAASVQIICYFPLTSDPSIGSLQLTLKQIKVNRQK